MVSKRLALAAVIAFYGLSGHRLILTNDQAYDLIMSVATGQLDAVDDKAATLRDAVDDIAATLRGATRPGG